MATAFNDFMNLLGSNRDYVLLSLAVLVLTEGAIIVLWARRATRLRSSMAQAVAEAERAASAARAAAASAKEESQGIYRVAERLRVDETTTEAPAGVSIRDGESKVYAPGRTSAPPAAAAPPAPTPAATAQPAAEAAQEYVTPVAQQAAAWVLPEVEASREPAAEAAPAAPAAPTAARPVLTWSPEGVPTAVPPAPAGPGDMAPTTLGWSKTSVPVEPAADFAVITDPDAVQSFSPPARPAPAPAATPAANGNGNGHATGGRGGWDAAMFGNNAEAALEDLPTTGDILLVEDDPTIARLYTVLLQSRGYTVRHAGDGLDGLDLANQRRPDLVLLDIMMPRMNGIAFLQALRSGPMSNVPVVVLSNFMEKQLVDDAMSLGALEYMVKAQTRPEALVGALPHWLRGERAFSY